MRLAYFSPLNPQACGISDYSEELLPYLAAHADIDLFVDGFQPANDALGIAKVFDYQKNPDVLDRLDSYDATIYHIGNDYRFHFDTCMVLRRHPGIVVFHDFVLEDTFLGQARLLKDNSLYLEEMEACHGLAERARAEEFMRHGARPPQEEFPLEFPLNQRVARSATGIIAHSEWSRARLAQVAPGIPTARISMPVKAALHRARVNDDAVTRPISLASFGLITPDKGLNEILQTLSGLKDQFDFHYTLVGEENPYWDVRELIIRHGMTERVTITGYVSLEEFERFIAATDIAINLRAHTVGETSASLCRIMSMGVPAVVSNIGWFAEIPDDCVVKVDPQHNFAGLPVELRTLLTDQKLRRQLGDRARDFILTEHNIWRAAERYLDFTREVIETRKATVHSLPKAPVKSPAVTAPRVKKPDLIIQAPSRRVKLAYFSPLNPQPSGISDYSEELLPHLHTYFDIDLFVDGFHPDNPELLRNFRIFDYQTHPELLRRLPDYDAVVYHLGNDYRYHSGIYSAMQSRPGIVVLHDFALQDFFLGMARQKGRMAMYFDEIEAGHGLPERLLAEDHFNRGAAPFHESAPLEFPLNVRIARAAEGIVVHSEWARERLAAVAPGVPIACVKHHITQRAAATPARSNKDQNGQVQLASFGLITPDKAVERILRVLSGLRERCDFHYTMVGSAANFPELPQLIKKFGLENRVTLTGFVSLDEFQQRILETDIAINLRERPVGATSGSLCRLMAAGVPAIVSNVGAFAELPDDSVVKIEHQQHGDALLQAYLAKLIADPTLRRRIGRNAREYVLAEHNIETSASGYAAFVREVIARRPRTDFLRNISHEMSAIGIRAHDEAMLRQVAAEVALLAPAAEFMKVRLAAPALPGNGADPEPEMPENGQVRAAPVESETVADVASISREAESILGRMPRVEGIDYKRGALEYAGALDPELSYYLRTKPFCNLHKPIKFSGDGMDPETARHFYDFANLAVALALRAEARILDVGCGPGWVTEYFARLGYNMTGIDISEDLIAVARERLDQLSYQVDQETPLKCRYLTHDIEAAPLDEKFDAIICYDALHHFDDEQTVFQNLAAMLDTGGVLFILEGHKPPAGSATESELRGFMEKYQTLESPFTEEYLRALIDRNGFAIVADQVSVNGLFERNMLVRNGSSVPTGAGRSRSEELSLPLRSVDVDYHYLTCMKVAEGMPGSAVPNSLNPGSLRARIVARESLPKALVAGNRFRLPLTFVNVGDTLWLTGQTVRDGLVMPAVKMSDQNGSLVHENHGPLLPRAVAPGRSLVLDLPIHAPEKPGTYSIKIDLVDQNVAWFEERGSEPLVFEVEVVDKLG